jgi:uracil-DNA glycosylase family protein
MKHTPTAGSRFAKPRRRLPISERAKAARVAEETSAIKSLRPLRLAEAACTRCPLYQFATQVVPGDGPAGAQLMLIGEQPGDSEDKSGKPFVGPAGRLLDRALQDAQIARREVYVTNAVKHFKHEMRGKRRLHKRPNIYEIEQCKLWLERELEIVKPGVVIALGATAARSILGRVVTISSARRDTHRLANGRMAFVTIHPSFLLRLRDQVDKEREYQAFVADLRRARNLCTQGAD